jgi:hypothetical protein
VAPEVYAREAWYAERPEPEEDLSGLLRRREPPSGPAARAALAFTLLTAEREVAIYAAHADAILGPLDGLRVEARGKLVDLTSEGYGEELWLAWIEAVGDPSASPPG